MLLPCDPAAREALLEASLSLRPASVLARARAAGLLDGLDPGLQACLAEAARRGRLAPTCEALAGVLGEARSQATARRRAGALPLVCLGLSGAFLVALALWVLPAFRELYGSMNVELPAVTTALLALGERSSWAWLALAPPARRALLLMARALRRPTAAQGLGALARRLPVLGTYLGVRVEAELAARVGVALAAGLDLGEASRCVARETPEGPVRERAEVLATSLADVEVAGGAASWARVARIRHADLEERRARLTLWVEGLTLGTLGTFVLAILMALRLPFHCCCRYVVVG